MGNQLVGCCRRRPASGHVTLLEQQDPDELDNKVDELLRPEITHAPLNIWDETKLQWRFNVESPPGITSEALVSHHCPGASMAYVYRSVQPVESTFVMENGTNLRIISQPNGTKLVETCRLANDTNNPDATNDDAPVWLVPLTLNWQ
jgi:hypothetical protein